jgi:hypothetical protein
MKETYEQPPYSDFADTNFGVEQLRQTGRTFVCGQVNEHPPIDVQVFPGHSEVALGATLGYTRHPLGGDNMVWVGHTLIFDPDRHEAHSEPIDDPRYQVERRTALEADGWEVMASTLDRLVAIKAKTT